MSTPNSGGSRRKSLVVRSGTQVVVVPIPTAAIARVFNDMRVVHRAVRARHMHVESGISARQAHLAVDRARNELVRILLRTSRGKTVRKLLARATHSGAFGDNGNGHPATA